MSTDALPDPLLSHHRNGDQRLTIEWNLLAAMFVLSLIGAIPYCLNAPLQRLPRVGDREISPATVTPSAVGRDHGWLMSSARTLKS